MRKILLLIAALSLPALGQGYSNAPSASSWFNATRITGYNITGAAFVCTTNNVACLDLGTGLTDYIYSDSSSVTTGGGLNVNGQITIQNSGSLYMSPYQSGFPSGTGITVNSFVQVRGVVDIVTIDRTALTAAATTQDITIWTLQAKTHLKRMFAEVTAGFDDGAGPISAVTATCGKAAGTNEYLVSNSYFTPAQWGDAAAELGASLSAGLGDVPSWSGTSLITCRFTSTGGNLNTLTTGSVRFIIEKEWMQ